MSSKESGVQNFTCQCSARGGKECHALGPYANLIQMAIDGLLECTQDSDESVQFEATNALGQLAMSTPAIIATLITLVSNKKKKIRERAAAILGGFRSQKRVVKSLLQTLRDGKDATERANSAIALGRMNQAEQSIMEGLIASLQDPTLRTRIGAAISLSIIEQIPEDWLKKAIKELIKQAANIKRKVVLKALTLLASKNLKIEAKEVKEFFLTALSSNNTGTFHFIFSLTHFQSEVRRLAAEGFDKIWGEEHLYNFCREHKLCTWCQSFDQELLQPKFDCNTCNCSVCINCLERCHE